jgi:hypothetical protein
MRFGDNKDFFERSTKGARLMSPSESESKPGPATDLAARRCEACDPSTPPLSSERIEEHLRRLPG